ncbi:MAG: alcohol dehydrogenase catalytic domain-containing protein [Propionicimonas sp.]
MSVPAEMNILQTPGDKVVRIGRAPVAPPGAGQVVVRTVVSAICGSEMRAYRGTGHPLNNGHEAAGEVVGLGAGVTSLSMGDRVGLSAIVGCGDCSECVAGRYTWCAVRSFVSGMHAEYITIAARACHLLPEDVDWATGVLISGDGLGVPYHSLTKFADLAREIVVVGLGPVGLGSVLLHAHLGRRVIGVDLSAHRRGLAMELGAAAVVEAGTDPRETAARIRNITGEPDLCVEAAGTSATLRTCLEAVRNGDTIILNGEQPALELSPSEDFIRRDITVAGAWFYHFHEFAAMLALVREGLAVSRLVTHRIPFEQAQAGYAEMAAGTTGKVLLDYRSSAP